MPHLLVAMVGHNLLRSPAAILAAAAAWYGFLQTVKRVGLDEFLQGRAMVVFNFAFGFLGAVAVGGSLSPDTLVAALAAGLAATGIHATVKTVVTGGLSGAPARTPGRSSGGFATVPFAALIVLVALASSASRCGSWDQGAYETLAVTKAVIDTSAADYQAGKVARTVGTYQAIGAAQKAQAAAVEAMESYELAKAAANTAPSTLDAAERAAEAAIGNLDPLVAAVEALDPHAAHIDSRH